MAARVKEALLKRRFGIFFCGGASTSHLKPWLDGFLHENFALPLEDFKFTISLAVRLRRAKIRRIGNIRNLSKTMERRAGGF
jgi:hypothetical protein